LTRIVVPAFAGTMPGLLFTQPNLNEALIDRIVAALARHSRKDPPWP
jgi:hypothetical protein